MLTTGTRIGSYEVIGSLGAGGMGEVYRARDSKLDRDVALKILPEAFASDPERLARFEREAKTLAALNHPHIGHIYGFEQSGATAALVMELVEGEDLAQRIVGGAIPIDDALPIARQIAEALEAAHRQGIIHRDLKPANIKLRPDGTVKVLDFGLAKLVDPAGGSGRSGGSGRDEVLNSPTITSPAMTERGIILGTAAYMAPEQAKGKLLDKRADNWAFGCVLYEMLTARRAFPGDDTSETLAAVLKSEPEWAALPADTPEAIRRLLRRCLVKDPLRRLADVADARIEIEDALAAPLPATPRAQRTTTWPRLALVVGASAVAFTIAGWVAARLTTPSPVRSVTRASIMLPPGQQFATGAGRVIAVSPEGSQVLYATPQGLYVRSLSSGESRLIAENGVHVDAINPAFSPDGQSIAYLTGSLASLKATSLRAGATTTLATTIPNTGGILASLTWDDGGVLVAAGTAGVLRFAPGAAAASLVQPDPGDGVSSAQMLPDREHVLFTLLRAKADGSPGLSGGQVLIQSVKSGVRQTIAERGGDARYVPTGHILYVLNGTLLAVPFDMSRLAVTGQPVVMVEGVRIANPITVTAEFGVSDTGTLVYLAGPVSSGAPAMDLFLIDRKGSVERLNLPPAAYETPRISPDGTKVAVGSDDGNEAIVWVYDLSGKTSIRRLTFAGRNRFPVWSADSTRVAFQSDREGDLAIFWQRADGSGPAERLTKPDTGTAHMPESWSPSGTHLLFNAAGDGVVTLWTLAIADRRVERFGGVKSLAPTSAVFSPDGRWVAYGIIDPGRPASVIFVQPFPPTGATYQVSRDGDPHHPVWSRDGAELSFVPAPGRLVAVKVTTEPSFSVSAPVPVANAGLHGPPSVPRNYDILKDGRFIGRAIGGGFDATPRMHIILNWFEELKTRVPIR